MSQKIEYIDLKRQYEKHKKEIDDAIHRVLDSGRYILGSEVAELEQTLAQYVGVKYAVGVSDGTDALTMALMTLGIGPGDEVITTPFTWVSTVEVISIVGATPVLADIDPKTYCIDPNQIERLISKRTKAIMPVSLFGQVADLDAINQIAKKHHLPVIEDGAQSFGARQNGKRSCSLTTIATTSFFPAKVFGCYGDGGMLFTDDEKIRDKVLALRVHGSKNRGEFQYVGLTGRLDTIQAAILLAKFPHFEEELASRERLGKRYSEQLCEIAIVPHIMAGNTHNYHQYTIRINNRDKIASSLQEKGIPTAIHYMKGIHEQEAYRYLGYKRGDFPLVEKACQEVLSLPMHPWMREEEQDLVIRAVHEAALAAESIR